MGIYKCTKCGSDQVESLQWVDLNSGESDTESEVNEFYCRSCGAHTDVEWKSSPFLDDEIVSIDTKEKPLEEEDSE